MILPWGKLVYPSAGFEAVGKACGDSPTTAAPLEQKGSRNNLVKNRPLPTW